jgi:hypothetical protein
MLFLGTMALIHLVIKIFKQKIIIITIFLCIAFVTYTGNLTKDRTLNLTKITNIEKLVDDAQDLLNFFHGKNIFLTDIERLKEISMFKNHNLELDFKKFLIISIPSFGVFYNDLENLLKQVRIGWSRGW